MLTIFGPIQWAFSLLPKWEGAWAKWLIRYLTVHFYGAMLYFVRLQCFITICISIARHYLFRSAQQICNKNILKCCVCFRESFPVCQSLITGTQMLNPHFHYGHLTGITILFLFPVMTDFCPAEPTYKDVAKITNFCRITSLCTSDIYKNRLAILPGIHVTQKYCNQHKTCHRIVCITHCKTLIYSTLNYLQPLVFRYFST